MHSATTAAPIIQTLPTSKIKTTNPRNSTNQFFDTSSFSGEAALVLSETARGALSTDLASITPTYPYRRDFPISSDGVRYVQLRLDAANAFNHANFAAPGCQLWRFNLRCLDCRHQLCRCERRSTGWPCGAARRQVLLLNPAVHAGRSTTCILAGTQKRASSNGCPLSIPSPAST